MSRGDEIKTKLKDKKASVGQIKVISHQKYGKIDIFYKKGSLVNQQIKTFWAYPVLLCQFYYVILLVAFAH